MVLARIIEPGSKLDSIRVLQEAGLVAASYPTINRRLPGYAKTVSQQRFSAIFHHKRESIDAHLTVVFAALAVSKFIETETGWSVARFVRTARRYRTNHIQVGAHTIAAADPLLDDLAEALKAASGHAH